MAAALAGTLSVLNVGLAEAQLWPFGGYGAPGHRRVTRPQRRVQTPPQSKVDVPLPIPRPRLPGDVPPAGPAAAPPVAAPQTTQSPPGPDKPPEAHDGHKGTPAGASPENPFVAPKASPPAPPVSSPNPPATPAAGPPPPAGPPSAPVPPKKPTELKQPSPTTPAGAPPEPQKPGVAPSGAKLGEAPRQPETDVACPDRLKARGVDAESITIAPQPDERCTVVQAMRLKTLKLPDGGTIDFPEHPTVACPTADAFSLYVRDLLSPLAKGTFGAPVASVWTGPGLECRSRDHIFGAKLSAHGQGLAIDIAQFKLGDGRMIEVGQAKDDRGQSFETAARNAACGYFHTVLGPGSDSYHRTHWHFDLEVRGAHGDSKFCK